ncbi:cytochrome b/b6 domain-containing protein [Alteriqipengyuania flavescens]|uniref:cytochrome b/b6 domain-containing protein n=1 Tax=Alteriqipengyuania flavescens TaxID=3053610 RepID=UPI0025B2F635|nr:cytochrome b/b6 domain-containing protein [Alteriqipengyuania flavescens]WJY17988.1 cytochrome b/b6 domain-containing protein [Alteriqipengyuania flavescens]WJY23929.1 cytochrome b/b6 domain-containing protein [Alteriqipengyuania flavescens]
MKRHSAVTRIWHWINLACVVILFMSGLNIANAHNRLYWGSSGFEEGTEWLAYSDFPDWALIPGSYNLAAARDWHLLMAWPFAFGLLAFLVLSLVNRHAQRDLTTRPREWRWSNIREDIVQHLKLNFEHGDAKYNFLQKVTYGVVVFVILPLLIVTGLMMSPAMSASLEVFLHLLGGRQSARSIHFICAFALLGFLVLHVALVILAGPIGQIRDMITGGRLEAER